MPVYSELEIALLLTQTLWTFPDEFLTEPIQICYFG